MIDEKENKFLVVNKINNNTPYGFVEFSRNNNPVDLFNDDIHWGVLKTYIGADEGLLYKYLEYDAMVYHDPVLNR